MLSSKQKPEYQYSVQVNVIVTIETWSSIDKDCTALSLKQPPQKNEKFGDIDFDKDKIKINFDKDLQWRKI